MTHEEKEVKGTIFPKGTLLRYRGIPVILLEDTLVNSAGATVEDYNKMLDAELEVKNFPRNRELG